MTRNLITLLGDDGPPDAVLLAEADYWDAVGRGDLAHSGEIDPSLAATIARLHALDAVPLPDPAFAARLEQSLIDTGPWLSLLPVATRPPTTPEESRHPRVLSPSARSPRRTMVSGLATAALVLLTLLSALVIGTVRFGDVGRQSPLLSLLVAQETVPRPARDPASMQGVLTSVTVPALPASASVIEIARWTFPATSSPLTTLPSNGPVLLYVTEGSLTAALDGAGAVISGRDGTPTPLTFPMEQQVRAGQALVIPRGARATLANPDRTATRVIAIDILEGEVDDWVVPWDQDVMEFESLVTSSGTFAPGPARLTLSRQTLAAGAAIPAPPQGTYQLVAAESKYLGYLARPPDGSVINREPDALGVLILTVSPT